MNQELWLRKIWEFSLHCDTNHSFLLKWSIYAYAQNHVSVSYGYCLNIHCKTSKQTYWKCYCKKRATGSLMPKLFFPQLPNYPVLLAELTDAYSFSSPTLCLIDNSHCFFKTSCLLPHQFSKNSLLSLSEFPFFPALLYMYLYLYQIQSQVSQLRISIHWHPHWNRSLMFLDPLQVCKSQCAIQETLSSKASHLKHSPHPRTHTLHIFPSRINKCLYKKKIQKFAVFWKYPLRDNLVSCPVY